MELVVGSLAILAGLVVAAAVIDLKARRTRRRIDVDPASVRDARRINDARGSMYGRGDGIGGGGGGV